MKKKTKNQVSDDLSKPQEFPITSEQSPRFRYEVKGDYIRLIAPNGAHSELIPRVGSHYRTLAIYRAARECLFNNLQARLVMPSEYKKLFELLQLRSLYFELMANKGKLTGVCVVCLKDLTGDQQSYCSELCRNTEKQRRARIKHPERKLRR